MAYVVNFTPRAERDLELLYSHIEAEHSRAARKWYYGLKQSILTLEEHPDRCPVTPENRKLWHLVYERKPNIYRVTYRVRRRPSTVEILHIRHVARRRFKSADL